jgi:hypothetical protein
MGGEIELSINLNGTVETPWWTPEIAEYICDLCGKRGTEACQQEEVDGLTVLRCVNINPYCG